MTSILMQNMMLKWGVRTMHKEVRTTVSLPAELLSAVDEAVHRGLAASRKEFMARAVRAELERYERRQIDEQFAEMANDPVYQQEAIEVAEQFAKTAWEALQTAEGDR